MFIKGYQGQESFQNDQLQPEDPLVLEWLKVEQDISTPDKKLISSQEDKILHLFNNSLVAMAFLVENEKERAERILDFYAHATIKNNIVPDLQNFYYKGEARGFFQFHDYEIRDGMPGYYNMFDSDRWMGDNAWLLIAYKYYEKKYGTVR